MTTVPQGFQRRLNPLVILLASIFLLVGMVVGLTAFAFYYVPNVPIPPSSVKLFDWVSVRSDVGLFVVGGLFLLGFIRHAWRHRYDELFCTECRAYRCAESIGKMHLKICGTCGCAVPDHSHMGQQ